MLVLLSILFVVAYGQASFRLPPIVQWENMSFQGYVLLRNSDEAPKTELLAVSGDYQYQNDGGAAFHSHMSLTLSIKDESKKEDTWSVLPPRDDNTTGSSYDYVVDDEGKCAFNANAETKCEKWIRIGGFGGNLYKQTCKQELEKGDSMDIVQVVDLDLTNHVEGLKYNVTHKGDVVVAMSIKRVKGDDMKPSPDSFKVPEACPPLPTQ